MQLVLISPALPYIIQIILLVDFFFSINVTRGSNLSEIGRDAFYRVTENGWIITQQKNTNS